MQPRLPYVHRTKKTALKANASGTAAVEKEMRVQFAERSIVLHICDHAAPPRQFHSQPTTTGQHGEPSTAPTSQQPSATASTQSAKKSGSPRKKFPHVPCVPAAQWPSCSAGSTVTLSSSSAAGAATKCCATSTSPHDQSHTTTRASCSIQANMNYLRQHPNPSHYLGHHQGNQLGGRNIISKLKFLPPACKPLRSSHTNFRRSRRRVRKR